VLRADNLPIHALRASANHRHPSQRAGPQPLRPQYSSDRRYRVPLDAPLPPVPPPLPLVELPKHALVFVGGLPQSGTSLVRELLSGTPSSSGMDTCTKSTRCSLTNIEGQWLLGDDAGHKGPLRTMYGRQGFACAGALPRACASPRVASFMVCAEPVAGPPNRSASGQQRPRDLTLSSLSFILSGTARATWLRATT
jgi:hypothetical protein